MPSENEIHHEEVPCQGTAPKVVKIDTGQEEEEKKLEEEDSTKSSLAAFDAPKPHQDSH